jgi:hypothetical protein
MIVHSQSPHTEASLDSTDPSDRDVATGSSDLDPFRQLFHRHANHLNSAQAHHMKAGLRSRLFAEKSEH